MNFSVKKISRDGHYIMLGGLTQKEDIAILILKNKVTYKLNYLIF